MYPTKTWIKVRELILILLAWINIYTYSCRVYTLKIRQLQSQRYDDDLGPEMPGQRKGAQGKDALQR